MQPELAELGISCSVVICNNFVVIIPVAIFTSS